MRPLEGIVGLRLRESHLIVGLISGSQYLNHAFLVLLPPILTILSDDLNVTLGLLGLAMGAQAFVNTALQLPFGYLADHYDRTIAFGLSSLLGAVGAILTAVAPDFLWLVAGQVVLGAGVAGHHPAHYPVLADATAEAARGRVFAIYNFGGSLGFATPPVVISAIIAVPGLTWRHGVGLLGVVGLGYAVLATAVLAWRVDASVTAPNVDVDTTTAPMGERIRSELRGLAANPGILALAVLALAASTANWGVTSYLVVFLTDAYLLDIEIANLTLTGLFVVGAGAILLGGYLTDRFGGGRLLIASFVGFSALLALISARIVPAIVAVGLFLVLGGIRGFAGPARDELTDRLAGQGTVGKSFAIVTIGIMAGNSIAPPVFGYIIEWTDVQVAFIAITAVAAVAAVTTVLVVWKYGDA